MSSALACVVALGSVGAPLELEAEVAVLALGLALGTPLGKALLRGCAGSAFALAGSGGEVAAVVVGLGWALGLLLGTVALADWRCGLGDQTHLGLELPLC